MTSVCSCDDEQWHARNGVWVYMCRNCGRVRLHYSLSDDPYADAGDVWWRVRATRYARDVVHDISPVDPDAKRLVRAFARQRDSGLVRAVASVRQRLNRGANPDVEGVAAHAALTVAELRSRLGETLPIPPGLASFTVGTPGLPGPVPAIQVNQVDDAGSIERRSLRPADADGLWGTRLEAIRDAVTARMWPVGPWLTGEHTRSVLGEEDGGMWSVWSLRGATVANFLRICGEFLEFERSGQSLPDRVDLWGALSRTDEVPRRAVVAVLRGQPWPHLEELRPLLGPEQVKRQVGTSVLAGVALALSGDEPARARLREILARQGGSIQNGAEFLAAKLPRELVGRIRA